MSRFSAFVRTPKGKGVALIVLATLAYAGLETLYMKEPPESKQEQAENNAASGPGPENFITHKVPKPLPEMALQEANGTKTGLQAYRGDWLVVNFWATWCAPCRKEMPQLDALAARYQGRGVKVIALSVDRGGAEKPEKFLNELGVAHLIRAYDPSYKAARVAGLIGLPTTLLVSPDGLEVGRLAGEADWDAADVHALLDYYLAQN
jgi:thiol-disulfide isomerase/thioredoxin